MGDTKPLLVAYGSETGNSQAIAEQLAETAESHGFSATLATLNEWKKMAGPPFAERPIVVIICSTTGNGGAPENAEKFVRFVKKRSNKADLFEGMHFRCAGSRRHGLRLR